MSSVYQICSSCGRVIDDHTCWTCRGHWRRWMRIREEMGGYREDQTDPVPEPIQIMVRTVAESNSIKACRWKIQKLINSQPCAGNTTIWKDDESGASSSWDSVVRAYEEQWTPRKAP